MNNQEYRAFRKEIMKYKNLVNQGRINRISKEVETGNKTRNQGLVEAYNEANIEYKTQTTAVTARTVMKALTFLAKQKIITKAKIAQLTTSRAMRAFVREVSKDGPSRPPCVKLQNARGCSNGLKSLRAHGRSARRAAGQVAGSISRTPGNIIRSVRGRDEVPWDTGWSSSRARPP
jgi:hypothetical protein|tara:strand:- start:141 stop:668 length:528 start_codon:yes stop_codon:yes gene_type:complete